MFLIVRRGNIGGGKEIERVGCRLVFRKVSNLQEKEENLCERACVCVRESCQTCVGGEGGREEGVRKCLCKFFILHTHTDSGAPGLEIYLGKLSRLI